MKLFSFWRSLATYRVRIALNLKGLVPDEVVDVNLIKGAQREAAYRAVNPMMALPALIDGEGPILFESLAIIEYLDETHPNPPLLRRDAHRACANIWNTNSSSMSRRASNGGTAALTALEAHLKDGATGRYCHGDAITLADICLASQAAGAKSGANARLAGWSAGPRFESLCAHHTYQVSSPETWVTERT
jgi:maleylacetoacetate isomerase